MGRKKKTLHDYAAEFTDLAVKRHLIEHKDSGETSVVETLYCKSCELPMRVRRDRILEHLASGRHYRNRRLIKQQGGRGPLLLSTGLGGHIPMALDSSMLSQPSFIIPTNHNSTCIATSTNSNMAHSPPSFHHPPLLSGHPNAISSTTSVILGREDQIPSTSSTLPSLYGAVHMQNLSASSRHTNHRHVISEASNSVATGGLNSRKSSHESTIGLAVIGVAHASRALLQILTEEKGCCLHYIVEDQVSEVERAFSNELLAKTRVLQEQDVDIVLMDQRVLGVVICLPPEEAAVTALETVRAGKAVLCEKLLSTNRQTVEVCFDEADRYGRPLVCGFYKRFDPALKFLYKKVHESTALGRIQRMSTVSRVYPAASLSQMKLSGGIFYNAALLDIDIVGWLLGDGVPDTIFSLGHAFCPDMAAMKDADTVTINMKFSSGTIVTLDISQHCTRSCDQRVELHGSQGSLRVDNQNPLGIIENSTSFPSHSQTQDDRYREAHTQLLRHFLRTIKGKEQPMVTKEQYVCAIQVAAAAEQSWKNGSAVDLRNEAVDVSVIKTEMI
ncbi:myo-inositol 2-dehydrogenase-like [Spea bombifrons]|uniref:myo-inositol 2-dehydrogenase-like n=1 Tax=Spea bombifrons TaxID=233779 RepID=UPI00234B95D2|nr:myo-inositol 2-dehydrogenase-like [Spea bombifrons]XP_053308440.1 myo-inositol 2-dehydrogenase-like [Spea bombifrons]